MISRGRTKRGRSRADLAAAVSAARPLFKMTDHTEDGSPVKVLAKDIGAFGDRWVEPFLEANRAALNRLAVRAEVRADRELRVELHAGPRIGAVPLLSPATRRVAAGLLIEPRFKWAALGSVMNAVGFSVDPNLGGGPLVPGSAREVPPWVLAGPVIERIAALLRHRKRGFVERDEVRTSPRGHVEWSAWATRHVPCGRWTSFPYRFSEPDDDPGLMAAVRWTLLRLAEDLSNVADSLPARALLRRASELQTTIGPGLARRPAPYSKLPDSAEWVASALEAMTWVAEERGLGGARSLDGLSWDLSVDAVWEAWIASFAADLAMRLGMVATPFGAARRWLRWSGPAQSMGALIPDVELRGNDRVIWLDAKYKAHLNLLARKGWRGLSEDVQAEHRADLHQALAYASLADAPRVDTLLLYPRLGDTDRPLTSVASVTSGRRSVRLVLAAVPFGWRNEEEREGWLRGVREVLVA